MAKSGYLLSMRTPSRVVPLILVSLTFALCNAQNETTVPGSVFPDKTESPAGGSCILNADGSYSGPGTCNGPLERSAARYSNLSITNGGTFVDQAHDHGGRDEEHQYQHADNNSFDGIAITLQEGSFREVVVCFHVCCFTSLKVL